MSKTVQIKEVTVSDARFNLKDGAGSDAIHTTAVYAYAICRLETDRAEEGVGLSFTLGLGNELVCQAIMHLKKYVEGRGEVSLGSRARRPRRRRWPLA